MKGAFCNPSCWRTGMRAVRLVLPFLLVSAAYADGPLEVDRYGGLKSMSFGPGDFFRTHFDGQRWWLVTPEGGAFLSLGVCNVNPQGDVERGTNRQPYAECVGRKYTSLEQWTATARDRLTDWGLNTLGAWSSGELRSTVPYTVELSVGSGLWGHGSVPDFFHPQTEESIWKRASAIDAYLNDPFLVGYYLDNELPWSYDWRRLPYLFPGYVAMPPDAPGKQRLIAFFKERYETVDRFSAVWSVALTDWADLGNVRTMNALNPAKARQDREDFVRVVARQYFKTATEALRAKDKHHLILGCRFVWVLAPKPVVQACGEYCDVVSINYYEAGPAGKALLALTWPDSMRIAPDLAFKAFHDLTNKPLLITEFGFRAMDSGMPNTFPPGVVLQPTVPTQQVRADKFEQCVTTWMAQPYFVGYHWFEYLDEPKGGRFDGEDGNYGLVNTDDEPYAGFIERFKAVNRRVWDLHAASAAAK